MEITGDHMGIPPIDGKADPQRNNEIRHRRKPESGDRVEISDRAKHLHVEHSAGTEREAAPETLDNTFSRIKTEIQERIRSGFYESEEVLEHVAKRILDLFGF